MKFLLSFALLAMASSSAFAQDIKVTGDSARYLFRGLKSRGQGIEMTHASSLILRRPIERVQLYDLLTCRAKDGVLLDSYKCRLEGTDARDIFGAHIINLSSDEWNDALANLNNEANRSRTLRIGGVSASRLYTAVAALSKDPSFFRKHGTTRFLKKPFEGVGINELYCQKTEGRLVGDSYKCFVFNVVVADTNAPVVVVEDPKPRE